MPPESQIPTVPQPGANVKDEIAHVLFIDVVGFTRLRRDRQILVLTKLQTIVRNTQAFTNGRKNGELIALPTGDGMALAFFNAVGVSGPAISCAEEIAQAILLDNETNSDGDPKIDLRMGIHSGTVVRVPDINECDNIAGDGINTAQRVMDCGDIGHILLSDATYGFRPTERDRPEEFLALGEVEVKHKQKVTLFSLVNGRIGNENVPAKILDERKKYLDQIRGMAAVQEADRKRRQLKWVVAISLFAILAILLVLPPLVMRKPVAEPTVAVLFVRRSEQNGSTTASIAKAFNEELIRGFKYLLHMKAQPLDKVASAVVESNSPNKMYYLDSTSALKRGQELGVRYVLIGTVESSKYQAEPNAENLDFEVPVRADLYDTLTGKWLWGDDFKSKPFHDLVRIENSIIGAVAKKAERDLDVEFYDENKNRADAHWSYLKGRFWSLLRMDQKDKAREYSTDLAIKSYQQAIDTDTAPYKALALSGLADIEVSLAGTSKDPAAAKQEALRKAFDAVEAAQKHGAEEAVAEPYNSIGTEKWWLERDYDAARLAFQLAIKSNPGLADSHRRLSACLAALNRPGDAEAEIKLALDKEPYSEVFQTTRGQNLYLAGNYSEAIKILREVITHFPDSPTAYRFLALSLAESGAAAEALDLLTAAEKNIEKDSDFWGVKAHVLIRLNRKNEALVIAEDLISRKERDDRNGKYSVSPYNIAVIYAAMDDQRRDALTWLDEAIKRGDPRVNWLNIDPRLASWRVSNDPDLTARLQQARIPLRKETSETPVQIARR